MLCTLNLIQYSMPIIPIKLGEKGNNALVFMIPVAFKNYT